MASVKTPEEISNILHNLNMLESYLYSQCTDPDVFENIEIYLQFLDQQFIRSNDLAQIYFQQVPGDIRGFWKDFNHLEEAYAIISGLDISIFKQFNLSNHKVHSEACYECVYVMRGSADIMLSEKWFPLKEGDFIFHQPGENYLLLSEPDSIVLNIELRTSYIHRCYQLLFSGCSAALLFFQMCYHREAAHNFLLFHTDNPKELQEIALHMTGEMLSDNLYKNEILRHYFDLLICYLKRSCQNKAETIRRLSAKELYYNDILQYLRASYRTTSLEAAAETFHLSKNYVSRIIRSVAGISFVELLTSIRIEKAKEYLAETSLVLEDIAELTGFSDASYLWRKFKQVTGMAPSEYREEVAD